MDPIAPFAVEVGRGTVIEGGFAAGVLRDGEGSAVAMVATVDSAGRNGKIVRLGRTRGDLDPPVITRAGSSILAAMLEPNAGGRAVKVAKVTGTEVTWGAEFAEGHDDSLTVDLAASGTRALVVWDDVLGTAEHDRRSSVMLGSFDVETMRSATAARPVSAPAIDAASPRIVARPGGYWLAYLARGDADAKQPAKKGEDEEDDTAEGEAITTGWVEVVPLDENGAPVSTPRAVTPKKGYAHSFDIEIGEDGGLLVAFRDDDTPTGAGGGKLSAVFVRLGGVGQPRVLAEEAPGLGIPDLLPGFISVSSTTGATRVATLSPRGELLDELAPEPSLGTGHPLAAARDTFLWARPLGRAMRLSVVRCGPRALGDAGAPPGG